jgi:hypothetical protein
MRAARARLGLEVEALAACAVAALGAAVGTEVGDMVAGAIEGRFELGATIIDT